MMPRSGKAARRAARSGWVRLLSWALALGGAPLAPAGVAGPAAAQAACPVLIRSCPCAIVRPGPHVLARYLTCPAGLVSDVAADGVLLNLGGRTVTGIGSSQGIEASGSPSDPNTGLRIENGTLAGFNEGMFVSYAPGLRVTGVTVTGGAGSTGDGIEVNISPGARLVGNTVTGHRDGIRVTTSCEGCRIIGNRIAGNTVRGIQVTADSRGARVEGNTVTGGGGDGIEFLGAGGPVLDLDHRVGGNTLDGNGGVGIKVEAGVAGGRLEGNRATGNAVFDLADENLPVACVNAWRGNRFATDNEQGAGFGPGAGCVR